MVGKLDPENDEFSGKNIIYLYPDLVNGIQGRFVDSKLIAGHICTVKGVELDPKCEMLIPKVLVENNDIASTIKIKRDVSTKNRISYSPLVPDAWEQQRVEVRTSLLETPEGIDAGEGLFAKTRIRKGQIVALFNGVRQESEKNSWSEYRIRLSGDTDIDIPAECTNIRNYCATLCHKANHSFAPNSR